jgi:predicted RNA-binding Zn ribbon-like protein
MPKKPETSWSEHHEVPADLAVLFDFLNTADERTFGPYRPADELDSPRALAAWLADHGLLPRGTAEDEVDLQRAVRLRDALRRCTVANRTRQPETLDVADLDLPLRATVADGGELRLVSAGAGVPGALGRLLASAVWASGNGSWARIKMCAAPDCRVVFYDHSKPCNGKWCSTLDCGNRMKTRNYRQRKQAAPR